MKGLRQFLLFLIIFIGVFSASGEAYFFYLNSVSADCDYFFDCHINTDKKKGEYAEELKKRGEELNLDIYTVDYKPMSHDSATYTVYSINKEVESLIKDKFKVKKNTEFNSIFSGKRKIIFKDIHEIKNNARITQYQVIGEKNNIDKFRMLTIDKYGTGKEYDGSYGGDHFFILMSVWSLALVVIVFITLIESSALKKEVSIKYINGHSKSKIIVGIIAKNACILTVAAVSAAVISNLFTVATAFGIYLICAVFGIVIVSSTIIYFQLRLKDIRKAFSSISNGNLQRITGIVLLSVTLVLFITSLSICMQNINNAYKTINQKELWKKYKEYESIVFFSSEESKIVNSNLDRKYAADFYNKYVNKYDISMSFDVAENGGMSSFAIDCDDTIIYANLNGVKKMELPIDISMIKKDKLYLLLPYTMEEFKQSNSLNEVNFVLSELKEKQNIEPQYISMDKPYEITLLDIKRDNLSTNCVKNPIVIIDTFSDINNNFAINIATSIMKFEKKGILKILLKA